VSRRCWQLCRRFFRPPQSRRQTRGKGRPGLRSRRPKSPVSSSTPRSSIHDEGIGAARPSFSSRRTTPAAHTCGVFLSRRQAARKPGQQRISTLLLNTSACVQGGEAGRLRRQLAVNGRRSHPTSVMIFSGLCSPAFPAVRRVTCRFSTDSSSSRNWTAKNSNVSSGFSRAARRRRGNAAWTRAREAESDPVSRHSPTGVRRRVQRPASVRSAPSCCVLVRHFDSQPQADGSDRRRHARY